MKCRENLLARKLGDVTCVISVATFVKLYKNIVFHDFEIVVQMVGRVDFRRKNLEGKSPGNEVGGSLCGGDRAE